MTEGAVRAAKLSRKFSHVLLAEVDGRLAGMLNAIEWPRCQPNAGEKLRILSAVLPAMGFGLVRQLRISNCWARHDPRGTHWHLGPIAVNPEMQGCGVGSALLSTFLAMADEQRKAAYLETDVDRNVALYQKFGFKVIARETIMRIDNRFMWREAHQ